MILAIAAFAAALQAAPARAELGGLAGCWDAPGEVTGKKTANKLRATWHMERRYLLLELHGENPGDPYDAAIILSPFGEGRISAFWMDSFGGEYTAPGSGSADHGGLTIDYRYPEENYRNRFEPEGTGWKWTITAQAAGKPDRAFAEYHLAPARCDSTRFAF